MISFDDLVWFEFAVPALAGVSKDATAIGTLGRPGTPGPTHGQGVATPRVRRGLRQLPRGNNRGVSFRISGRYAAISEAASHRDNTTGIMSWIYPAFTTRLEPSTLIGLRATTRPNCHLGWHRALIEGTPRKCRKIGTTAPPLGTTEDHGLGLRGQLNRSNDEVEPFAPDSRPALFPRRHARARPRGFAGSTPRLYGVLRDYWIFPITP